VVGRLSPAVGVLAALGEADPGRTSRNNPAAGSALQPKPLLGEMRGVSFFGSALKPIVASSRDDEEHPHGQCRTSAPARL
jgi:hypothetical protein